jgi:hypothetical protein
MSGDSVDSGPKAVGGRNVRTAISANHIGGGHEKEEKREENVKVRHQAGDLGVLSFHPGPAPHFCLSIFLDYGIL